MKSGDRKARALKKGFRKEFKRMGGKSTIKERFQKGGGKKLSAFSWQAHRLCAGCSLRFLRHNNADSSASTAAVLEEAVRREMRHENVGRSASSTAVLLTRVL